MRAETPCLCANTSHISLPDWRLCWKFAYEHHFPPEVTITVQFDLLSDLTHHCKMAIEEATDKLCATDRQGAHLWKLSIIYNHCIVLKSNAGVGDGNLYWSIVRFHNWILYKYGLVRWTLFFLQCKFPDDFWENLVCCKIFHTFHSKTVSHHCELIDAMSDHAVGWTFCRTNYKKEVFLLCEQFDVFSGLPYPGMIFHTCYIGMVFHHCESSGESLSGGAVENLFHKHHIYGASHLCESYYADATKYH